MFKPTPISVLMIILMALLSIVSCSQEDKASQSSIPAEDKSVSEIQKGGVYRIPLRHNPVTLDPAYVEDSSGVSVVSQVFEGLVRFGPYLSIMPAVAKDWQFQDQGTTIRFILRPDAYFHHGKRVTAQDAIFTIKRLLTVEPAPSILPHLLKIKGAQAYRDNPQKEVSGLILIDEQSFEIQLEESYAPLLGALAMYQAAIVPEDVVNQKDRFFGKLPIGCGAFKFVDWQSDKQLRLERNTQYYAGAPYLDQIEFRIYAGELREKVLNDFKDGKLHEMWIFGAARQQLAEIENLQWVHRPSLSLLFYGININHSRMQKNELRRALAIAIDRSKLVETVYNGQFEPARTVLPPGMPGHNREFNVVEENITLAKTLMQQINPADANQKVIIEIASASQSAFAKAEFAFIKNAWSQIGIETRIKYITDWSEFEKYLNSDEMQIFRYSWTADMPDPDNFLHPLFSSGSLVNFTGFQEPEVDLLLKKASAVGDPVQRAQLYQKIEQQVMQAYPIIP